MKVDLPSDRPRLSVPIDDGSEAVLSPIGQGDRVFLEEGLEQLSDESRYSRFGLGRGRLSERELDYLANVDQRTHVAWGASIDGNGAGVGRYIVVEGSDCAEVAVTVLDEYQGRGLGKTLLRALLAVARHDGIEVLCFEVIPGNVAVQSMLAAIPADMARVDGLVEGRLAVADVPKGPHEDGLVAILGEFRS